jgi:hypothetical protein
MANLHCKWKHYLYVYMIFRTEKCIPLDHIFNVSTVQSICIQKHHTHTKTSHCDNRYHQPLRLVTSTNEHLTVHPFMGVSRFHHSRCQTTTSGQHSLHSVLYSMAGVDVQGHDNPGLPLRLLVCGDMLIRSTTSLNKVRVPFPNLPNDSRTNGSNNTC